MKTYVEFEKIAENKKSFTSEEAKEIGEQLGITWDDYDVDQFRRGMDVELEHGTVDANTDVTGDDPLSVAKIALAHLNEFPDYYDRLDKMETEGKKALEKESNIKAVHIDIQPYIVDGVKHYRARRSGEENFTFESTPNETLDQFRWWIMNELDRGIVTHFLGDWIVSKVKGDKMIQSKMSSSELALYCLNNWDYYGMNLFMQMEGEGVVKPIGEGDREYSEYEVGGQVIGAVEPDPYQNEKGLFNWKWEIKSTMEKQSDVGGVSLADQTVEWLNNFTPENEEKFMELVEQDVVKEVTQYPQLYDEMLFKVGVVYIQNKGDNEKGLDEYQWVIGKNFYEGDNERKEGKKNKIKGMKHTPRDYFLPGTSHLIASWETRGGRYYYDLYEIKDGYMYTTANGFNSLGNVSKEEAISQVEKDIETAKEIDGINFRRVL